MGAKQKLSLTAGAIAAAVCSTWVDGVALQRVTQDACRCAVPIRTLAVWRVPVRQVGIIICSSYKARSCRCWQRQSRAG